MNELGQDTLEEAREGQDGQLEPNMTNSVMPRRSNRVRSLTWKARQNIA